MKFVFARSRETWERLLHCAARFLLACILSGAQLGGGFAPFALGFTAAAGAGWEGLAALLGTAAGALLFLDFSHALRTLAVAVLLFSAGNAFCDARFYRRPWFVPALSAGLMLAVEFVYLVSASGGEAAYFVLAMLLAALSAFCSQRVLEDADGAREHPVSALVLLLGVLMTLSLAQLRSGFAPGRIVAALAVLLLAFEQELGLTLGAALGIGLAMDLAAPDTAFAHTACYALGALAAQRLHRGSRVRAALLFALCSLCFTLPLRAAQGLILLYENLFATLVFLLLPTRLLRARRAEAEEAPDDAPEPEEADPLRRRLHESALALRELYAAVSRAPKPSEEDPSVIFTRAQNAVCRRCTLRGVCWERDYARSATALADATKALLRSGCGTGADFPAYFSDRCIHFASFLGAVNAELSAYLLRRAFRQRLEESRARSATQYSQLSELLSSAAEQPAAPSAAGAALAYQLGAALRPKRGERVSGDALRYFETDDGELCLLLSDGMGSGEAAHRESALAARLLERFLRSGVEPGVALKTLNGALALRAEAGAGFTTLDLLRLSLRTGEGELYKYGAAPSYLKQGGRVRRITCACLPAGLQEAPAAPETTHLRLTAGSFFVMLTDGAADATDDEWLQNLLAGFTDENPQRLVSAVLEAARAHRGEDDDMSVLALYLPADGLSGAAEV